MQIFNNGRHIPRMGGNNRYSFEIAFTALYKHSSCLPKSLPSSVRFGFYRLVVILSKKNFCVMT